MKILTNENKPFSLNDLPEVIDDIRYCVLDCTDPDHMDFFFIPLIFLESFSAPAIVMNIGGNEVTMPIDWNILAGDPDQRMLEILPLTNLNDRGFQTPVFNPLTGYMVDYKEVQITNIFQEIKWYFPKLKHGHILSMPLTDKPNSPCAYFVKDTNQIPDIIDVGNLL